MQIEPVGHIETPYFTKFGVPRQPGLVPAAQSTVVVSDECDWLLDVPAGSYVWLIWDFSLNHREGEKWAKTIRPPLLGGTQRVGVFSSRSSFRPNNLAISSVRVQSAKRSADGKIRVRVADADMVDGTPIYEVLPYDPVQDCHVDAHGSWNDSVAWPSLELDALPQELVGEFDELLVEGLEQVLRLDPRPAYTRDTQEDREFWVQYGKLVCTFSVQDGRVVVHRIFEMNPEQELELRKTGTIKGM